jgi:short-subunit dehydrogenase
MSCSKVFFIHRLSGRQRGVITGASSGIGEQLAHALACAGVKLVLSARREHELKRVKQKCLGGLGSHFM